jgi:hypothetical protein
VIDLLAYRRNRLALRYRNTHPWDSGVPGHLAALLGCARAIERSVGDAQFGPERLAALRYSFKLRLARVEKALKALAEEPSTYSGYVRLIDAIHELDALLERLHQEDYRGHSILENTAANLARCIDDEIWLALLDIACEWPCQA